MECIILSLNIHLLNQNQKMKKQCVISLLVYESDTKKMFCIFLLPFYAETKKGN